MQNFLVIIICMVMIRLDKSLAKHGFTKDDITDVFLTHLHFDHCGGSIAREGDKLVPAFKNATYWSNETTLGMGH